MADYSINAVTRRVVYTGSAGVGPYAFSFEVLAATDIAVYKNSTKLTLTTNYTVTINANGTGSVTLTSAATGSDTITIIGSRAIERTTDFVTAGDLLAASLNEQLDSQIVMIQQLAEENKRTLRAPPYDPAATEDGGTLNMALPPKATRAGKVLAFNSSTGNPEMGPSLAEVANVESNANAAAASAASASASASSATASASSATASASSAATSASSASASASTATSAASSASSSASSATASASTATTKADEASASAALANDWATKTTGTVAGGEYSAKYHAQAAATSASTASSAATTATSAQAAAEAARDATLASFDSFDDRYLGTKTSNPTVDNDGNALVAGALYFNSVVGEMRLWTGSAWVAAYVSGSGFLSLGGGTMTGPVQFAPGTVAAPGISASGDTNTGIFFPAADTIAFAEGGVEAMRINSSGNVGIGTNSPSYPITVSRSGVNTYLYQFDGTGAMVTGSNGSGLGISGTFSNTEFALFSNSTERFRIGTSGQLGIGGANYGTSGQVLTSQGASAAPAWADLPAGVPTGSLILGSYYEATTTGASGTGSVATITFTPAYTIPVGNTVTISGVTPSGYNGVYTVTASSSGSVSFASATTGSQTVAGVATMTPAGSLLCNGAIYTRSSYPTLAALIGTPILASNVTNSYTFGSAPANAGFSAVNDVLFSTGTAGASASSAVTANALFTSTDGINWTSRTAINLYSDNTEDQVAYNGTTYVATCSMTSGGTPAQQAFAQYSTNLSTWTKVLVKATNYTIGTYIIGWGAGIFVTNWYSDDGCSAGSGPVYSTTGTSGWTTLTLTGAGSIDSVAGYASGIVIVSGNKLFYSASGATMTDITSSITQGFARRVSYANGQFIVGTSTGYIYTSTTGAGGTWTLQNTATTLAPNNSWNRKWRWNGTAYASANGYYTTNWKDYGSTTTTTTYPPSAIANGNKLYSRNGTAVYWWDFNSYTTSTQFPVPNLSGISQNTTLLNSPYFSNRYFIKT